MFDGFTITGGNNYRHGVGGGFYALGKININNCYVVKNRASYENVAGAGIYITLGTLSNSKVSINSSSPSYGGGIYCNNGEVNNCVVSDNCADVSGGGIYNEQGSINNCTVLNNHVRRLLGAGYYYQAARSQGGGIYNIRGTVNKCAVVNNSVYTRNGSYIGGWSSMSFGGGIYNNCGIVSNCCVNNNQVYGYSLNGTDISGGGGIYNNGDETEQGFVYNTTIVNNANGSKKSDYVKNTANSGADYNCIINVSDLSRNFVRYTSFIGTAASEAQNSELYQADWRLKSGSEYIDAGSTENLPDWIINGTDLAGNPRIHNGKIDLGAYEYNGSQSGIKELLPANTTVFFNSATGSVTVSGLQGSETLHFYHINGNLLFSRRASGETENIPVGHLPAGVYFVKVDNGQVLKWVKK